MGRLTRLDKIIDLLIAHANSATASEKTKDRLIISVAELQKISEEDKQKKKAKKETKIPAQTSKRFQEL